MRGPRHRPASIAVCAVAIALVAPGVSAAPARYNVLLVSLDSVRGDFLGCYGHRARHAAGVSTSPELDRLAAAGIRMEDAYASSSWTLPSHVSLMTGEPELVHGVDTDLQALDASTPTLAEILERHGYQTAGVFSGPYLEPQWGFGRGFDRYRAAYGPKVAAAARLAELARANGGRSAAKRSAFRIYEKVKNLSHRDVNSPQVTAAILDELERLRARPEPWFLFAHYFDPHYDYVPPPPYDTRFDPDYRGTITADDFLLNPRISTSDPNDPDAFVRRVSDRDLEHIRALYEGEIAWVDAHVGQLLRRLDALDLARTTLVVVLSDHGDEFFEHGGIGHHRTLYEEVVRVPMILRLPGVLPAGTAVPGPVSLDDVLPTILDLLGIPAPEHLPSASFLPLVRGRDHEAADAVLGRLVTLRAGHVTIDGSARIAARQTTVQESFRRGAIKITRVRSWPEFPPDLPERTAAVLRPETQAQYGREQLSWVDVRRSPDEPAGSSRFDDATAHAALDAFRTDYARLLTLGRAPARAAPGEAVRHALRGLGYVEAQDGGESASATFRLPPPGDGHP